MREKFMANRIIAGLSSYTDVVTARPDLKEGVDTELILQGYEVLIIK